VTSEFSVEAFPAVELGNASFLVTDKERGEAIVIDPHRDVDGYLRRAESLGVKITRAFDTHLHNDFVSGRRELQAEAGTDIADMAAGEEMAVGAVTVPCSTHAGPYARTSELPADRAGAASSAVFRRWQ